MTQSLCRHLDQQRFRDVQEVTSCGKAGFREHRAPCGLLERRRRAKAALTSVVAACYLLGVSTRRMGKLVETLGITRLSRSQVSETARDLDEQVEAFRTRPLDAGPYTIRSSRRTLWC